MDQCECERRDQITLVYQLILPLLHQQLYPASTSPWHERSIQIASFYRTPICHTWLHHQHLTSHDDLYRDDQTTDVDENGASNRHPPVVNSSACLGVWSYHTFSAQTRVCCHRLKVRGFFNTCYMCICLWSAEVVTVTPPPSVPTWEQMLYPQPSARQCERGKQKLHTNVTLHTHHVVNLWMHSHQWLIIAAWQFLSSCFLSLWDVSDTWLSTHLVLDHLGCATPQYYLDNIPSQHETFAAMLQIFSCSRVASTTSTIDFCILRSKCDHRFIPTITHASLDSTEISASWSLYARLVAAYCLCSGESRDTWL